MNTHGYALRVQWAAFFFALSTVLIHTPSTVLAESTTDSYTFISIDVPDDAGRLGDTSLSDINDQGHFVGGFSGGQPSNFLIVRGYRRIPLECPDAKNTGPAKINNRGDIVGSCFDGSSVHAFLRDRRGHYILLDFPGAIQTEATGINDHREVVGYYRDEAGVHGFLWRDGKFSTVDVPFRPFPHVSTLLQGINNHGQIVGVYMESVCACEAQGFFASKGHFHTLSFPGAQITLPADINNRGQIVGIYFDESDRFSRHGFLLDDGNFTTIDVPFPGVTFTEPHGINDGGVVVGRYLTRNDIPGFDNHGFVATPTMRNRRGDAESQDSGD